MKKKTPFPLFSPVRNCFAFLASWREQIPFFQRYDTFLT